LNKEFVLHLEVLANVPEMDLLLHHVKPGEVELQMTETSPYTFLQL
jgi:hypothetical protein